jgi:hypothetical protein
MNMIEEDNMMEALTGSAGDKIAQRLRSGLGVNESDFAKVTGLMQVQPGDLITADMMNRLLRRLARLELLVRYSRPEGGGAGDPFSVLGKPLSDAARIISIAGADFSLGMVLDTNGAIVQTTAPGTLSRIVIGQFFVSDDSTSETKVNLLVTSPNATGFFKEMGAETKDIIAKVVYQAVETQIARILDRNKRSVNSTNDVNPAKNEANTANAQPMPASFAASPAATGNTADATASATKRRASKKASKGGQKTGGGGDAGGVK